VSSADSMHSDRWEAGSEFQWIPFLDGPTDTLPQPATLYVNGRAAMIAAWRQLAPNEDRRMWIPDYFCADVVEVLSDHGTIVRYADDPRWTAPEWESLAPVSGDVVLAVNYFGVRQADVWREWQAAHPRDPVIEDHSHDPFSLWARGSRAAFAFASLRKTVPVPDGAVLWSPRQLLLPSAAAESQWFGSALKLAAMVIKADYLRDRAAAPVKEQYRRFQIEGEARLIADETSAISPWSAALLSRGVPRAWRRRRAANVGRLVARLTVAGASFKPLFAAWPKGHTPFNVVLTFASKEGRDAARDALRRKAIYCAVHWPQPEHAPARVRDLAERILTVPVDQRYSRRDVDRVADVIIDAAGVECPVLSGVA
jgi:hypothetical protein